MEGIGATLKVSMEKLVVLAEDQEVKSKLEKMNSKEFQVFIKEGLNDLYRKCKKKRVLATALNAEMLQELNIFMFMGDSDSYRP